MFWGWAGHLAAVGEKEDVQTSSPEPILDKPRPVTQKRGDHLAYLELFAKAGCPGIVG